MNFLLIIFNQFFQYTYYKINNLLRGVEILMDAHLVPIQPNNPSTRKRHEMLFYALREVNRLEDFNNIITLLRPPCDISKIASPGEFKGVKIGIIGGGLAGLSSSFELRKLGFDITIFEALEDRIGGRVYTYYFDKNKNIYGELGPMRIPISHETTWHYINLFNLNTRPFIQYNENAYIYVRDTRVRNDPSGKNVMEKIYPKFPLAPRERITPWQKLVAHGLGTPLWCIPPYIRKEILQIKPEYHPLIQYWDALGTRKVLEKMKLSQGAINLISSLVPFAGSFYYNSYSENLQEDYPVDFSFLYEIVGGMVNLPLSFYHALLSENPHEYTTISPSNLGKITWKGGNHVTHICQSDNNKVILKYKNKHLSETLQESFDYIICTIPFSSLRNVSIKPLFSTRKMEAIREVNYVTAQRTLFHCNKRFWEEGGCKERIIGGGSYTDLPISTIWYPSDHPKGSPLDPGVLLASYNFTLDAIRLGNINNERRFKLIKNQVEAVHGLPKGYLNSIVEDYKTIQWNKEPWFYGAFCYFMPEQKRIFSYAMVQPEYNNRIFFAGEHASPNHAWQQGALNSGMKAANNLAYHCKKHRKY